MMAIILSIFISVALKGMGICTENVKSFLKGKKKRRNIKIPSDYHSYKCVGDRHRQGTHLHGKFTKLWASEVIGSSKVPYLN